jgi:hypothetical protein
VSLKGTSPAIRVGPSGGGGPFSGAMAYLSSTSTSWTYGNWAQVYFDTVSFDTDSYIDLSTNTVTFPATGSYRVGFGVQPSYSYPTGFPTSGLIRCELYRNGGLSGDFLAGARMYWREYVYDGNDFVPAFQASWEGDGVAGDTFQLWLLNFLYTPAEDINVFLNGSFFGGGWTFFYVLRI